MARHQKRKIVPRGQLFGAQSGSSSTIIGGILIVFALFVGGVFVWFYQSQRSTQVELNPSTLCPKEVGRRPPAVYVVLLDQTDPIQELQRKSVANQVLTQMQADLEGSGAEAMKHARVEIWTFSDGTANTYKVGDVQLSLSNVLSICNPGSPAKWDHLYKNADVVKKQHARFYASVRDIVESSLRFPEAKQSPVIEALYGIGAQVFSAPAMVDSRKRLLVVSDLLQNTRTLNFFASKPNFEAWRRTPQSRQTLPNLQGVAVTAFVVPGVRADLQGDDFARFWVGLLTAAGATNGTHAWLHKIQ
ncbi:MAG: hypothetical protein K2Y40_06870 [Reyranella sp.]|nr:hypothetical protein [Reyranella sp.]